MYITKAGNFERGGKCIEDGEGKREVEEKKRMVQRA